ncbi:MAG: DUF1501 domain-containing protein [Myxococcales bacterium]|nr:DUF1501 domain-containing protein [Myxococcales bacterium]
MSSIARRRILQGLGLASAGFLGRDLLKSPAFALPVDPNKNPLLVVATFPGGWDQMLALDPRDLSKTTIDSAAQPSYDLCVPTDPEVQKFLVETKGSGVLQPVGSKLSFGPGIGRMAQHWQDLCLIRSLDMGTLTHEVGRRFLLTGKFPRGLEASGSALGTWWAAQGGDSSPIPNLVVGGESYNEGLDIFASGLRINAAKDLLTVLTAQGAALPPATESAITDYLMKKGCGDDLLNGDGLVDDYLASRNKSLLLASGKLGVPFQFTATPSAEIQKLYDAFHINSKILQLELAGPRGQVMLAGQALAQGISQAVSINVSDSIDHHDDDWELRHARDLREGFNALADLIDFLKATPDKAGVALWSRTTLLVCSDFARTPKVNARGGRDHHLASSCLLAGKGIKGDTVIGATDSGLGMQGLDPLTGQVDPNQNAARPPDVHATLLHAAGLGYSHISNQMPRLITAALA